MRKLAALTAAAALAAVMGFTGAAQAQNLVAYWPAVDNTADPTLDAAPAGAGADDATLGSTTGGDTDEPRALSELSESIFGIPICSLM